MAIQEIFPNPTVKQVIFQVRFPNLFSIESKIGDFQAKIMKEFPKSSLVVRQEFMLSNRGDQFDKKQGEPIRKIWQFSSEKGYELHVLTNSLDIVSNYHKTYNNPQSDNKFRDIISFVTDSFLEVVSLTSIERIGLRYIDECPISKKTNVSFKRYYNSTFPTSRFSIQDAVEMDFRTVIKKNGYYLGYMESLQKVNDQYKLILDFDGSANEIESGNYLSVTDDLHQIISEEYKNTIKKPVYDYMKKK